MSKGIITDSQYNSLVGVMNGLPTTGVELDKISTAASILSLDTSGLLGGTPLGTEKITSSSHTDVKGLTVPAGATRAIVTIHKNNIIFRVDGDDPAVEEGHIAVVNTNITIGSLNEFKFISDHSSNDAVVFVSYF
jgi:hypothetical protein